MKPEVLRVVRIGLAVGFGAAGLLLYAACGSDDGEQDTFPGDDGGGGGFEASTDEGGNLFPDGGGTSCGSSEQCGGDPCIGGQCCPEVRACAKECCGATDICVFEKCQTPGKQCHTANDCADGQYCETGLGGDAGAVGDGGVASVDGSVCTQPIPLPGRCIDLPPKCASAGDGGASDGGSCLAACEYHPEAGVLDAVPRWTWGPKATTFANTTDVWATPTVGRVYDGNCDGTVDVLDAPNVIFVSGNAKTAADAGTCCQCDGKTPTSCHTGVLRVLDGRSGQEIWSLDHVQGSEGFAGTSCAIGDIDGDGHTDIVAATGEGNLVVLDSKGNVKMTSTTAIKGAAGNDSFGWGGGIALADMDGDGHPEIAYANELYATTNNTITLMWRGDAGVGGSLHTALPTFVDLDDAADHHLELAAGNSAYKADGSILWRRDDLPDGFPGIGDFDKDGKPEVALVQNGKLWLLNGLDGTTVMGPLNLPGTGSGGAPTVADFNGDGKPEIGIAMATFYAVLKPNYGTTTIDVLWKTPNHDLSSSVTGSTVFDFEGDGKAEVIYGDECFLWVFDGTTGAVKFSAPHTSFTGTESSLVADVDGDGRAEMLMVSNGADPSPGGSWPCLATATTGVVINGVTWTPSTEPNSAYRGLVLFGDKSNSWVGTRSLWNEHTYHVSNICDDRDTACVAPNVYGSIPKVETRNWTLPWLNDFRQNVQDKGLFDAPDPTVAITVDCTTPVIAHVTVRNVGAASLPAGVGVGVYVTKLGVDSIAGKGATTHVLFPGQVETLDVKVDPAVGDATSSFKAAVVIDPNAPLFHECRADNDTAGPVKASCAK